MRRRYIVLFFLALLFWTLLTWSLNIASIVAGVVIALLTSIIFGKYFYTSTYKLLQIKRFAMVIPFLAFFTWQCIKANIDVAWRVVQRKIPIKPAIIKTPLLVQTELARAILSCALSMTPGTIVMDIKEDFIYVHWIYVDEQNPEPYAMIRIRQFEKYIATIFD